MGGVGDDSSLFRYSGPLKSVGNSENGACITSLLVLVDRAKVKRGRGKLGPVWARLLSGVTDISAVIGSLHPSIRVAVIRARSVTLE